jgi:hypothetical protein
LFTVSAKLWDPIVFTVSAKLWDPILFTDHHQPHF